MSPIIDRTYAFNTPSGGSRLSPSFSCYGYERDVDLVEEADGDSTFGDRIHEECLDMSLEWAQCCE